MCNCIEGKFDRTTNNFALRENLHPFAKTFINAKSGSSCLAPPVHDCAYIKVRNQLSVQAWQFAAKETMNIENLATRDSSLQRRAQEETRRLITEYYKLNRG